MRGSNETKAARARKLRQIENDAESKLWSELRGRRLNGSKFVRQCPIGPYFADFACRATMLVVEVDGSQHAGQLGYDSFRDRTMSLNGWAVLRFWHIDVLRDRKAVVETILAALDGRLNKSVNAPDLRYQPAAAQISQS